MQEIIGRWALAAALVCAATLGGRHSLADGRRSPTLETQGLIGALDQAEDNRPELERALRDAPPSHARTMAFLIEHMPAQDLRTLDADFLLDNVRLATEAAARAPWRDAVPEDVFRNFVLPYASLSEPRDPWRADFVRRFGPLVEDAMTPGDAALILNRTIFRELGVKYSPKRRRADQSPRESIEQGKASCTGLSILLVNACRAVGVPARVVGTPNWWNKRGNHTWVEVWDGERGWRFVGASEPHKKGLDHAWFKGDAARADPDSREHAIYAATWAPTGLTFPMVWTQGADPVPAINVTRRYLRRAPPDPSMVRLGVRARLSTTGARISAVVRAAHADGAPVGEGSTRDERFDLNDVLAFDVPRGAEVVLTLPGAPERRIEPTAEETIVDLELTPAALVEHRLTLWMEAGATGAPGRLDITPAAWAAHGDAIRRAAARFLAARAEAAADVDANRVRTTTHESPYTLREVGERPAAGWPLVIAMHGGGGVPKEVNDAQWAHMQVYYRDQPQAGGYLYCALRAPTDQWNGFYTGYVYPLVDQLVRQLIACRGVDPDRVHLIGYSHGGYGAFSIGTTIPDRFAAVHASAAAPTPGQTVLQNLRNTRFTCMIGEHDEAYGRIERCRRFAERVAEIRAAHPGAYPVEVVEQAGFGHSGLPDRDMIAQLLPHRRVATPRELTWRQIGGRVSRHFWLEDPAPGKGRRIEAACRDNVVTVRSDSVERVILHLDERLIDLTRPVVVRANGRESVRRPAPSLKDLTSSLMARGDAQLSGCWLLEIELGDPATPADGPGDG